MTTFAEIPAEAGLGAVAGRNGIGRHVRFAETEITEEARAAAAEVLASGWVTTGPQVVEFERDVATWVGATYGIAVSSCTAAIEIALGGLHLQPGAKVLTPTLTFCGAVQAIIHAGFEPVLVDCDPVTLTVTPDQAAAAAHGAGGADAMVVLHFAGYPVDVTELAEAARLPMSRVIEDAAHAIGTKVADRWVGSTSMAACFSFYATKNLPIGEGGMITTDDPDLADYARQARLHGMSRDAWRRYMPGSAAGWKYAVDMPGLKANLTDVQAAIGRAQLRHLTRWQERRELLASRYDRLLREIGGITTPSWPASPAQNRHAWHLYVAQVGPGFGMGRDELIEELGHRGIGCSVHFIPIHHHPHFQRVLRPAEGAFPGADAAFERIVSLPMHPGMTYDDVTYVASTIAEVRAEALAKIACVQSPTLDGPSSTPEVITRGLRTLIVGAGEAGQSMARDLRNSPEYGLRPVGFLDDDPDAETILDLPVLGMVAELPDIVANDDFDVVVLAIPSLDSTEIQRLAKEALAGGVIVRYLPSFIAALERDVRATDLRQVRVDLLLGRPEMRVVRSASRSVVGGKRVLVTGAGGSIGTELSRQINGFGPSELYLLDHDESNLHTLQLELEGSGLLDNDQLIIADIRDRRRMEQIFRDLRPEVVFHAAAHKHLPLLERHPCEGVKSNVLGTLNLAEAAISAGTGTFVLISTDKAADPTSILGATKRLAEMVVASRTGGSTKFASVRFGNVLGSRGSFLSVLREQIRQGGAVTVTHPDVTRFFMTVEEAVGLVIEAASMVAEGSTFVLDMGEPVRIIDLVHNYASQLHLDMDAIEVRYTGLRPGEKLNEALFSQHEVRRPTSHPKVWVTETPPFGDRFEHNLQQLFFAAAENGPEQVRALLAELLPDYSPDITEGVIDPAVLAAPYPDGF